MFIYRSREKLGEFSAPLYAGKNPVWLKEEFR
jgi:hypothetical protein